MSKQAAPMPEGTPNNQPPPPYGEQPPAYNPAFSGVGNTMGGQQVYYPPTQAQPHPQAGPVYYQNPAPSPYSQPVPGGQPVYYQNPAPNYQPPYVPQRVPGGAACRRCGTVYPLPNGAISWRCKTCSEMNNVQGDQCVIL